MNRNAVGWFEIYVQDMPRAKRFYESLFKISLKEIPAIAPGMQMWQFEGNPSVYGAPGALVKMEGIDSGGNGTLVYFNCDDCGTQEGLVNGLGGKVERSKMSIGQYGFISIVRDTEGNRIGLHSMK